MVSVKVYEKLVNPLNETGLMKKQTNEIGIDRRIT